MLKAGLENRGLIIPEDWDDGSRLGEVGDLKAQSLN